MTADEELEVVGVAHTSSAELGRATQPGEIIVDGVAYSTQADMGGDDWYAEEILDASNEANGWVRPMFYDSTHTVRPWRGAEVERFEGSNELRGPYADHAEDYVGMDLGDVPQQATHYEWMSLTDRVGIAATIADAVAAAVRDAAADRTPTTQADDLLQSLTGHEIAALALDAVVFPAAVIDTAVRHHLPLPEWPADTPSPTVAGHRTTDGQTRVTVSAGAVDLVTVTGAWNGQDYTQEFDWPNEAALGPRQQAQVMAWAREVWVRMTDALDNVVDHALAATVGPVLARITTDTPTTSAQVLAELVQHGVSVPGDLPKVAPASPTLAELTAEEPLGAHLTTADVGVPDLPDLDSVRVEKTSAHSFTVLATVVLTVREMNKALSKATGVDVDFAATWAEENASHIALYLARQYGTAITTHDRGDTPDDASGVRVAFEVPGIAADTPALGVADRLYGDPNLAAFLSDRKDGALWRELAAATGLPVVGEAARALAETVEQVYTVTAPPVAAAGLDLDGPAA